jgi:hypothetical protein
MAKSVGVRGVRATASLGLTLTAAVMTLVSMLCSGCTPKLDPNRPFAMTMDGADYSSRLADPIAYVQEFEAGFSTSSRCTVLFPLRLRTSVPKPGLEIGIDPQRVRLGEDMTFDAADEDEGVSVEYVPMSGHQFSRGVLLVFSSGRRGGSCTLRLDQMDLSPGGRVKGKLIRATLYGFHDGESAAGTELDQPRKLELANFPFDLPVQSQEQALARPASLAEAQ